MSFSSHSSSEAIIDADAPFGNKYEMFLQLALERVTCLLDKWASKQQAALQDALDKITAAKAAKSSRPCQSGDEVYARQPSSRSTLTPPHPPPMSQLHRARRPSRAVEGLPVNVGFAIREIESFRSGCVASSKSPSGLLARAIRSQTLALVSVAVVIANIVCLALETENDVALASEQKSSLGINFFVPNLVFVCFYGVELLGRAYIQRIRFLCGDEWRWNLLDFILLWLAIQDLLISQGAKLAFFRLTKILKLFRTLKLIKLIRVLKSLRLIVNGVWSSVRSLFWAFFLILFTTFAFSLWFTQACSNYLMDEANRGSEVSTSFVDYFGSVLSSMGSLYEAAFGGDNWAPMVDTLGAAGDGYRALFFAYIAFFSLVVLNTLTSLFVEATMEFAERDAEDMVKHRLDMARHYTKLLRVLFNKIDLDGNGRIDFDELMASLGEVEMVALMSSLMIDVHNVKLFIEELQVNGEVDIDVNEFITKCTKLKGTARSIDLIAFQSSQTRAMAKLNKAVSRLSAEVIRIGRPQPIDDFWKL